MAAYTTDLSALQQEKDSLEPEIVESKLREVEKSIKHLKRSNRELAQAISECGEDSDFRSAINENVAVVLRKQNEAAELSAILSAMRLTRSVFTREGTKGGEEYAEPIYAGEIALAEALPVANDDTLGTTPRTNPAWQPTVGVGNPEPACPEDTKDGYNSRTHDGNSGCEDSRVGEVDPRNGRLFL
mmetsp:Transcript_92326/g.183864  ORF Transcript_92326/g.183864 Transcript_92326/m.183864 type:complete len:186 (-) Transcript_92326:119-676(-)